MMSLKEMGRRFKKLPKKDMALAIICFALVIVLFVWWMFMLF